jgi:hypothetical protein
MTTAEGPRRRKHHLEPRMARLQTTPDIQAWEIQGVQKFVPCPSNSYLRAADGIRSLQRIGIGRNFLLVKNNPEIKVPRRCRGHVRLKYIVRESLLVMDQRTVVRFLTLKTLSARDITAELEEVYGHEALSLSVVKKWCKRFVNGRITLEGDPWSGRPPRSDLLRICYVGYRKESLRWQA